MTNHPNRKKRAPKAATPKTTAPVTPNIDRTVEQLRLEDSVTMAAQIRDTVAALWPEIARHGAEHVENIRDGGFEPFVTLYVALTHVEHVRRGTFDRGRAQPGEFTKVVEAMQAVIEESIDATDERMAAEGRDPTAVEPNPADIEDDDPFGVFTDMDPENYYSETDPQGIPPHTIRRIERALSIFLRQTGDFAERFTVRSIDYQGFTGEMLLQLDEIEDVP